MIHLEEKLAKIRDRYKDNSDAQTLNAIDADEKALRELIELNDFSKHKVTQEILRDAKQRLQEIDFLLANDEDLNLTENAYKRYALFRQRDVWGFILARFGDGEYIRDRVQRMEKDFNTELGIEDDEDMVV